MRVRWASIWAVAAIVSLALGAPASFAAPAGQRVFGTIQSVSADSLTVTGRGGTSTVVKETAQTKIVTMRRGTIADIRQGETVRVMARQASDGTLTAFAIQTGRFDVVPQSSGPRAPKSGAPGAGGTAGGTVAKPTVVTGRVTRIAGTGATRTLSVNYVSGTATISAPDNVRVSRVELMPAANLKTGMRVFVNGAANSDGSVTASTIMVQPERRPGPSPQPGTSPR